jgi:hypothetical protein
MKHCDSYIIRHPGNESPAVCTKCETDKLITSFYIHSYRGDGAIRYRPICKDCRRKGLRTHWPKPIHSEIVKSGKQTCKKCQDEKPLSGFYINGCFPDGLQKYRSTCKTCVLKKSKLDSPKLYKSKSEKRSASPKNFISGILNHAAKRKQHLGFDIDIGFLLQLYETQNGKCALSGVEMTYSAGNGRVGTNISIDRIDSKRGYVRGNVQFVCDLVNRMKQDCEEEQFFEWCRRVLKVRDEKV